MESTTPLGGVFLIKRNRFIKNQYQTEENERYVVLFFKTSRFSGQLRSSDEGEVFWIPRETLPRYNLSVDFLEMVDIFESENLSEFYYYKEDGSWKRKLL